MIDNMQAYKSNIHGLKVYFHVEIRSISNISSRTQQLSKSYFLCIVWTKKTLTTALNVKKICGPILGVSNKSIPSDVYLHYATAFQIQKRLPSSPRKHPLSPPRMLITHKCKGSQQPSRVKIAQFIDSTQGKSKDIYKV